MMDATYQDGSVIHEDHETVEAAVDAAERHLDAGALSALVRSVDKHGGACVCSQCVSDGYQYPIHHTNCPCPVCQQRRLEEGAKAVLDRQCAFHGSIGDLITLGASIREALQKLTVAIEELRPVDRTPVPEWDKIPEKSE